MKAFKAFLMIWATIWLLSGLIESKTHCVCAGLFTYAVFAVAHFINKSESKPIKLR